MSAEKEPVAWAAVWPEDGDGIDCGWVYDNEEDAIHAASGGDGIDGRRGVGTVVPLYRSPTLTDAEREALEWAAFEFDAVRPDNGNAAKRAAVLRGLLSRTGTNSRQTSDNAAECADQKGKTPERDHDATPSQHATHDEGSVQNECALTDKEREAVRFCCTAALPETAKLGGAAEELCRIHGWTLRSLLERVATAQVVAKTATSCGLTSEEQWALETSIGILSDGGWGTSRLRGLLARLSPPTT